MRRGTFSAIAAAASVAVLLVVWAAPVQARSVSNHRLGLDGLGLVHPRASAFLPETSPVFYYGGAIAYDGSNANNKDVNNARSSGLKRSGLRGDAEVEDDSGSYFGPRVGAIRQRSALRRDQELRRLYDKIAREFPFMAKQGLNNPGGGSADLDDLFSMTLFGQPKG